MAAAKTRYLFNCPCHDVLKGVPETFKSPCGCTVTFRADPKNPIISENHVRGCDGECHSDALRAYKDAEARYAGAHRAYPLPEWATPADIKTVASLLDQAKADVKNVPEGKEIAFLRELVIKGVQARTLDRLDKETLYHLQVSAQEVLKRILLQNGLAAKRATVKEVPLTFSGRERKLHAPFWMLELVKGI
jgi:hypothetical protein